MKKVLFTCLLIQLIGCFAMEQQKKVKRPKREIMDRIENRNQQNKNYIEACLDKSKNCCACCGLCLLCIFGSCSE